jgi:hypothetical protein
VDEADIMESNVDLVSIKNLKENLKADWKKSLKNDIRMRVQNVQQAKWLKKVWEKHYEVRQLMLCDG